MDKTKETLLVISIGAIASGVALIEKDIITGLILVAVGVALVWFRGWLKVN